MADSILLRRLVKHNAWATRTLLDTCEALDAAQFTQRFDIGPGSLHDTLLHIVGAMIRWADRIGERPLRPSVEDDQRTRTPREITALLEEASADLGAVMEQVVAQGRVEEPMTVEVRESPDPFVFTRGTAIIHVLTHGVHHRAQALNMLRRLGVAAVPDIDAVDSELVEAVGS